MRDDCLTNREQQGYRGLRSTRARTSRERNMLQSASDNPVSFGRVISEIIMPLHYLQRVLLPLPDQLQSHLPQRVVIPPSLE